MPEVHKAACEATLVPQVRMLHEPLHVREMSRRTEQTTRLRSLLGGSSSPCYMFSYGMRRFGQHVGQCVSTWTHDFAAAAMINSGISYPRPKQNPI